MSFTIRSFIWGVGKQRHSPPKEEVWFWKIPGIWKKKKSKKAKNSKKTKQNKTKTNKTYGL